MRQSCRFVGNNDIFGYVSVTALVCEKIGLKATSVRTYVGKLISRRLLVRLSKGTVALAPILLKGAE